MNPEKFKELEFLGGAKENQIIKFEKENGIQLPLKYKECCA